MAPSTQRVYHEPSPPSSPSVDEMDEEEEFVVVDDDIHGRWVCVAVSYSPVLKMYLLFLYSRESH